MREWQSKSSNYQASIEVKPRGEREFGYLKYDDGHNPITRVLNLGPLQFEWWITQDAPLRTLVGFLRALPGLPKAIWVQRHEIVNALFRRHVWLGKEGRKAYEEHLADVERWRKEMDL